MSAHLKYSFRFHPDSRYGKLYPHTYQGIGVSYHSFFDKAEIGTPVAVYAFQGARIARLSSRLSLDYEWNFGASFGWKKYHPGTNAYNYVKDQCLYQFGILAELATGGRMATDDRHRPEPLLQRKHPVPQRRRQYRWRQDRSGAHLQSKCRDGDDRQADHTTHQSYDIVLYGASKRKGVIKPDEAYLAPGSFGVLGFNFNPMYNFHQYFRAGASLDVQYDESANIKEYEADYNDQAEHRFYRPPFKEQLAVGLSVRGELVMPIFTINVGIGYNVYHKCTDTQGMYQILALKTSVTRNLFLHVGYQLSKFKDPNNLMLGIGYRFHNKR